MSDTPTLAQVIEKYENRNLVDEYDCCGCSKPWDLYDELIADLKAIEEELQSRIKGARGVHARNWAAEVEVKRLKEAVEYALQLRMYGERAPGGDETWAKWDSMAETTLRALTPSP
jgi:hypothetical protein